MPLLFVYGTLKKGLCRHFAMEDQEFLGTGQTMPGYTMFDLGDYPGLVASDSNSPVHGEVYCVDNDCLARLDGIEGVQEKLYHRGQIKLASPWHEDKIVSYFYLKSTSGFVPISNWLKK